MDRARHLAVRHRMERVGRLGLLVGVPNLVTAWWVGPVLVGLVAAAVLTLIGMLAFHRRTASSEVVVGGGFLLLLANTGVSIWVSGGFTSPLISLVAVTIFTQAVSFRLPVLFTSAGVSAVMVALAGLTAPDLPADRVPPPWVELLSYTVLATMLCGTAWALALSEASARAEAATDPLTGLRHRRGLEAAFAEARGEDPGGRPSALLMVDVDHFKRVNDTYGHERGDQVLVELARRMTQTVRPGDVVLRLGGEEFVVLLPDAGADRARAAAERLRRGIAHTPVAGLPVTVSIGVATDGSDHADVADLLSRADRALYEAKHRGRDRVVLAADDGPGTEPSAGVGIVGAPGAFPAA